MQLQYDQLSALVAVVREGSFDRDARALNLTPSAVSQRIKQLEERVRASDVRREMWRLAHARGKTSS